MNCLNCENERRISGNKQATCNEHFLVMINTPLDRQILDHDSRNEVNKISKKLFEFDLFLEETKTKDSKIIGARINTLADEMEDSNLRRVFRRISEVCALIHCRRTHITWALSREESEEK